MIEYSDATNSNHAQDHKVKDPAVRCLTMAGSTEMINVDGRKTTQEIYLVNSSTDKSHSRTTSNDQSAKQTQI